MGVWRFEKRAMKTSAIDACRGVDRRRLSAEAFDAERLRDGRQGKYISVLFFCTLYSFIEPNGGIQTQKRSYNFLPQKRVLIQKVDAENMKYLF